MTEQSSSQEPPDDWSRGGYAPGEQYAGEQYYDAGASGSARPGSGYGSSGAGYGSSGSGYGSSGSGYGSSGSGYGSSGSGYGSSGSGYGSSDPGYGSSDPGYGSFGSGGSGYGSSGQGGSGYGSSGQGSGAGAVRPALGPSQGTTGPGAAGRGLPTTPIWQAAPGQAAPGQAAPGQAAPGQQGMPGQGMPGQAGPGLGALPPDGAQPMGLPMGAPSTGMSQAADARGFLSALFDFSFTSFVTTKIIKALYVLILVVASLVALFYTIVAFRLGTVFGFLTLVIGDPLYIIIVMAFWRLILEAFVVVFRMAEDVRAIRERGGR